MRVSTHHGLGSTCRNCGAALAIFVPPPRYCSRCGQETALHPPSLREFVHEFVGHYIALEGRLWKTLVLLLLHPGRLTREYLAGRRRRYVQPLRLYLSASFLFFVLVKLLPGALSVHGPTDPALSQEERAEAAEAMAQAASIAQSIRERPDSTVQIDINRCQDPRLPCSRIERTAMRVAERWRDHPDESARAFGARVASVAPYALFLMLPVFAGLMMAAYRNRKMVYGEHVVFGLHLHAFWFFALLAAAAVPEDWGLWALPLVFVYGVWAMHRVYGGRWSRAFWRAVFVSTSYLLLLLVATLVLLAGVWLLG